MRFDWLIAGGVVALAVSSTAAAQEFDAAIGQKGYGRCHMDYCGYFIIDAAAPIGSSKAGTLFVFSTRSWGAQFKRTDDDDAHEYDRPPVSVEEKKTGLSMVFCSKTKPVIFDFYEGKWEGTRLRPGDESAVFGATESAYQFYYAACHHYITQDPVSKAMALKLGYAFAKHPLKDSEDLRSPAEKLQPMDVLK